MSTEIELKAHVQDSKALKALLFKTAEYSSSFEKEDTYWVSGLALPIPRMRVRKERRSLHGGSVVQATLATYKIKEVRGDIEVNEELEFEVNPGQEFEQFLESLGFKPGVCKRKQGWAFSYKGIIVELVDVEGLGWFIELEVILAAGSREEAVEENRRKLLAFLDDLGISRDAIESRYYTEMLYGSG